MAERRGYVTRLSSDFGVNDSVCFVESNDFFPDEGNLCIEGEYIYYSGKGVYSFDGLTRGLRNSLRRKHKAGSYVVFQEPFDPLSDVLAKALQWIEGDIAVDDNGEIYVDNRGDIKVLEGVAALDQALKIRVKSSLGEGMGNVIGVDVAGKTSSDEDINDVVSTVVNTVVSHESVDSVDNIQYAVHEGMLIVTMHVYVRGLTQGFQFLYKIQYNGRF